MSIYLKKYAKEINLFTSIVILYQNKGKNEEKTKSLKFKFNERTFNS